MEKILKLTKERRQMIWKPLNKILFVYIITIL